MHAVERTGRTVAAAGTRRSACSFTWKQTSDASIQQRSDQNDDDDIYIVDHIVILLQYYLTLTSWVSFSASSYFLKNSMYTIKQIIKAAAARPKTLI